MQPFFAQKVEAEYYTRENREENEPVEDSATFLTLVNFLAIQANLVFHHRLILDLMFFTHSLIAIDTVQVPESRACRPVALTAFYEYLIILSNFEARILIIHYLKCCFDTY